MKLLLFTQALDKNDPTLSAYHRLVKEIARNFDEVVAVCLKKGENDLPSNVKILSLGKEEGLKRFGYILRFYRYLFTEKYDAVFVHMNQEYILLGGIFWKLLGKPVYMWRNHHAGTFLTDIAAAFCRKVYCTSKFSYTAKYAKTELMPVGIDTLMFKKDPAITKAQRSVLFLARMAPVKKPHVLIDALASLKAKGVSFTASLIGDPLEKDREYYEELQRTVEKLSLADSVRFIPGIPNDKTPGVYSSHDVSVNLSSSGMYDKTIFEAMACESMVLACNKNLNGLIDDRFIFEEDNVEGLASKLHVLLDLSSQEKLVQGRTLRDVVETHHSLEKLGQKLIVSMR